MLPHARQGEARDKDPMAEGESREGVWLRAEDHKDPLYSVKNFAEGCPASHPHAFGIILTRNVVFLGMDVFIQQLEWDLDVGHLNIY